MELRDYQREAIQRTLESIEKTNKQVWVMATGTGKTVAFAKLASHIINTKKKKILILAHREELLEQAKDKLLRTDPTLDIGIEQAENVSNHIDNHVIIASVPTLGREGSTRIKKFDPKQFGLVVVDEAHHASANSYINIFKHFGVLKDNPNDKDENMPCIHCGGRGIMSDSQFGGQECFMCDGSGIEGDDQNLGQYNWNKDCLLLGVTATPSRSDNKGIDQIFDEVVFEYNIVTAIKEKFLSPIHAMRIKTNVDLSNVGRTAGDFNVGELEEAVNIQERNDLVVKAYKEIVPNKQALVFAVNIEHALALTETFIAAETKASFVIGSTDKQTRSQRLTDFYNKKINVLVNVGVLTEGIDIPSVDAVLMARPTQSGILYNQMLGRGTRLFPGKDFLMVIDFVDNTKRQRLQTVSNLLGKTQAIDFKGNNILDIQEGLDTLQEIAPGIDLEKLDINRINELIEKAKYDIESVDLLGSLRIPSPLAQYSKYEWLQYDDENYKLNLGTNKNTGIKLSFTITETLTGKFQVYRNGYDTIKSEKLETLEVGSFPDLRIAVEMADRFIERNHNDVLRLISSDAPWKKEEPTEKQIYRIKIFLSQGKLNPETYTTALLAQMTKGDAARAISNGIETRYGTFIKRHI